MAKRNINKYRELDELPKEALTVGEYAKQQNVETATIYKRWERKNKYPVPFAIVLFKTMNYIIPKY